MPDIFSKNMQPLTGSAIREIFKLLDDKSIISLAGGNPNPELLDNDTIATISAKVLAADGKAILQYGATNGYGPFLNSLPKRLTNMGVNCENSAIMALTGSTQGIELSAKVLLNRGDVILTENPSFLGALQTFNSFGAIPVGVDMDFDGILPQALEDAILRHNPKMLYVIPNFQNPTGITMSLQRRKDVLALCKKHSVIILEDDPYGEVRFEGQPLPSIKSMDEDGIVILLNSFSKTVSPGLRVGYAVGRPDIIAKMIIAKQGADAHTSNLSQALVNEYLVSGEFDKHLAQVKAFYTLQRNAMIDAIKSSFASLDCQYVVPSGGMFVWLKINGINATDAFKKAVESKVAYVPGTFFFPDGGNHDTLRLNFSMPSLQGIAQGIDRLAAVFSNS